MWESFPTCVIGSILRLSFRYFVSQYRLRRNQYVLPLWVVVVGVNKFRAEEEAPIAVFKIDDSIRNVQAEKLRRLRNSRDKAKVDQLLQQLNDKAMSGENLMPVVIEAVENKITLGEIADELRSVFGEYK